MAFSRELVRTDSWGYPEGLEWDPSIHISNELLGMPSSLAPTTEFAGVVSPQLRVLL